MVVRAPSEGFDAKLTRQYAIFVQGLTLRQIFVISEDSRVNGVQFCFE